MKFGIATALATVLPFAGPAALAQHVAQPSYYSAGDLGAFHGTANSLVNAIDRIERMTGGKVAEIRFANVDGMRGYHAVVTKGGRVEFLLLEEKSGRLSPVRQKTEPDWMLHWQGRVDANLVDRAQVPLDRAIRTAEAARNGEPAIAAGLARSAAEPTTSVHAWNVLIDQDGREQRVAVDDSTGEVIADPQALAGWP